MTRLSNFFLYSGVAIATLGVVGYIAGAWFNLPPEAVRAIAFALPFVVGGVLMVAGAMVGRTARREAIAREAAEDGLILPASDTSISSGTTPSRESATERAT